MTDDRTRVNAAIGLCVIGCIVAGIAGTCGGIAAVFSDGDFIGGGICLASAGLSFGLALIAMLLK